MRNILLIIFVGLGMNLNAQNRIVKITSVDSVFSLCSNPFEIISKNDSLTFKFDEKQMIVVSNYLFKNELVMLNIESREVDSVLTRYIVNLDKGDFRRKFSFNHCYGFDYEINLDDSGNVLVYCICYGEKKEVFTAEIIR